MEARVAVVAVLLLAPLAVASEDPAPPVRYVVGFHGAPPEEASFHGERVLRQDEGLRFLVVEARDPRAFEARASADAHVRYVERDPVGRAVLVPDDPSWSKQYGPPLVGAPAAWDRTVGASAVAVCVADTGVRYTHQDLAGARWLGGKDYVNDDADAWDDHGHGTHVTGTLAATLGNGRNVAGMAQASFRHVKVLNETGRGWYSDFASGMRWCADHGTHVVSLSLGGTTASSTLANAVEYAWDAGAVVVAAAGNEGECSDCVIYPARYEPALAVACVTSSKERCSFSSSGPEVDVAAPGLSVLSLYHRSDTDQAYMSGTSMSTPHVAGVVALMKSHWPSYTNERLREVLLATAEDLGPAGVDPRFGHGLARADAAVVRPLCSDGVDQDGDGRVDMDDPGCAAPEDETESPDPACGNLLDDDGDGHADWPHDPDCAHARDDDERTTVWKDAFDAGYGALGPLLPWAHEAPRDLVHAALPGAPGGRWTRSGPADYWHVDDDCVDARSPPAVLAFTRLVGCTYHSTLGRNAGHATTPEIAVAGRADLALKFWHRADIERFPLFARDVLEVQVSLDGGPWTTVLGWDSRAPPGDAWRQEEVPLPAASTLRVRFLVDTMDASSNTGRGWFVDDVEVVG